MPLNKKKARKLLAKLSPADEAKLLADNLTDDIKAVESKITPNKDYSREIRDIHFEIELLKDSILNKLSTLPDKQSVDSLKKNYLDDISLLEDKLTRITTDIENNVSGIDLEVSQIRSENIKQIDELKKTVEKLSLNRGGAQNRQININSSVMSLRYTDMNLKGGITKADNNTTKQVDVTFADAIGGTITGGTDGSVLFIHPASVIAQDNANFFWDDTNNRLGIGTNSPQKNLDISGDFAAERILNTSSAQFAGAGFYLINNVASMGSQAGAFLYMGILDGSATQGFLSLDKTNVSGGGTVHLMLFNYNDGTVTIYDSLLLIKTITQYNSINTVSNGIPSELAAINTTGLTANVSASTLYAVPSTGAGMYRVSTYVVLTTAGSVSSTLPNAQIVFTDNDSSTSITIDSTPVLGVAGIGQTGALTANTVGTASSGVIVINAKASTTIQYQTVNYASTAAGMTYAIHIILEKI